MSGQPASSAPLRWHALVIGASAGGLRALQVVLGGLAAGWPLPVLAVLHRRAAARDHLAELLAASSRLPVKAVEDKTLISPGSVYLAPANYHLLVECQSNGACSLALSIDERVAFARPSIDVLFCSAADAYGPHLIGLLLTGANHDGAAGLERIRQRGGLTIAQDPASAESSVMPLAAIRSGAAQHVIALEDISAFLNTLLTNGS